MTWKEGQKIEGEQGSQAVDDMLADLRLDPEEVLGAVVIKRATKDGEVGALVHMSLNCHGLDELNLLADGMAKVAADLRSEATQENARELIRSLRDALREALGEPEDGSNADDEPIGHAEPEATDE
jgi:hypothetical protein